MLSKMYPCEEESSCQRSRVTREDIQPLKYTVETQLKPSMVQLRPHSKLRLQYVTNTACKQILSIGNTIANLS